MARTIAPTPLACVLGLGASRAREASRRARALVRFPLCCAAMRELATPPRTILDDAGAPRAGSFRGPLPPVDLAPLGKGALFRLAHHKRWMYVAVATDELLLAVAIVQLGYAANTFAFAFDRRSMRMVADESSLGPSFAGRVERTADALDARYRLGAVETSLVRARGSDRYALAVAMPDLLVEATIAAPAAPPAISAVAKLGRGLVNATEKRALLPVSGEALVAGRRYTLDRGVAGYDYTHGYLARHTAWRWAFAMGRAKGGARVALNLVEGFVGEPECAVWIDDELFPVGEGRFRFERDNPRAPWHISTADGAVDLELSPGGVHAEHKNLGVVRSRFVQPAGTFRGTIRAGGRELELDDVLGVTEDQDVVW
jgi:hypothetical protein